MGCFLVVIYESDYDFLLRFMDGFSDVCSAGQFVLNVHVDGEAFRRDFFHPGIVVGMFGDG